MLLARSKEAGIDAKWEDFEDLENGQVDEKLEKIAACQNTKDMKPKEKVAPQKSELNGARFGMAYKIVREYWPDQDIKRQRADFIKAVVNEYKLTIEAEEAVKASSSSCSTCDNGNRLIPSAPGCVICGRSIPLIKEEESNTVPDFGDHSEAY